MIASVVDDCVIVGGILGMRLAQRSDIPRFYVRSPADRGGCYVLRARAPPAVRLFYAQVWHMAKLVDGLDIVSAGELGPAEVLV